MANYRITANPEYNSNEVYFESKPAPDVLAALKNLKMRWNPRKGCWYGFAEQNAIIAAINGADKELGGVVSDGYMGAMRWDGNKSNLHLYGSDLSKAIRAELKAQGIKGCSVACKTYSGGQSVCVTIKADTHDFVSLHDFIENYTISPSTYWIWDGEEQIFREKYWSLDGAEQQRIRDRAARAEYTMYSTKEQGISHYHIDQYKCFTPAFLAKLHKINAVLDTFHYNDSNGMVDYFNTNFYRDIYVKPVAA